MRSKSKKARKKEKKAKAQPTVQTPSFHWLNWVLLVVAAALIGFGFLSLSRGSITLAPILLILGYCVVVPLALVLRPKGKKHNA